MRCRWSYDAENDDLLVYSPDAKSKGAVEWGNFVFDVDKQNALVGIQVLDASKSLAELMPCGVKLTAGALSKVRNCWFDVKASGRQVVIKIFFELAKDKEVCANITAPRLRA